MTRNADRLEILARDLASRYGENDHLVRAFKSSTPAKSAPRLAGCRVWAAPQRHTFKHARLAKLGISSLT